VAHIIVVGKTKRGGQASPQLAYCTSRTALARMGTAFGTGWI